MLAVIAAGEVPKPTGTSYELARVKLLAPIPRPPKLICIGLNYHDHAAETKLEIPAVPTIFCKFPNTVIGHGEKILLPNKDGRTDYEAEFAFVIGTGGRRISAPRAMNHVFGYTIMNDVSERRYQMATSQWMIGKTFDTFAPMGPCLVTADEVPDLTVQSDIGEPPPEFDRPRLDPVQDRCVQIVAVNRDVAGAVSTLA